MRIEKKNKFIHFTEWYEKEEAIAEFETLKSNTEIKQASLICSQHWASQGYWIEFPKPELTVFDSLMDSFERI